MRRIAVLGASSQIAKDLIRALAGVGGTQLLLFARDLGATRQWLQGQGLEGSCSVHDYAEYGQLEHSVVLNFVGVGDPQRAAQMGAGIFEITQRFDDLALRGLYENPQRRYVFLSSGAAYGSAFLAPAGPDTRAEFAVNALTPQDYYALAKLHAEAKHRAHPELAITDLRVFNYFSRTQDLSARFFITDILRAIQSGQLLRTSSDFMQRDYLHPADFHRLLECILAAPPANRALDCYTRAPVDKPTLLAALQQRFGLRYESLEIAGESGAAVNATGAKPQYYSLNHHAATLGYRPFYTSLEGILVESAALLGLA
ncbi:NAD-dependent epimerase/dehydratase family protein [Roseateles oligotrophus]|uniref:NAD(P)-dependent oxidoreductase n=1 Tax=Roseateles oligotrophus TaxID=1769250 RepID=A0ABT2YMP4_9BURK|nr:NAD(P)-dependent oxidoreductase [Roseateles oligotrophus]MCV2371191.1 NAD(P)-dependent oxidoreductase [Roseateles oligotrophus]